MNFVYGGSFNPPTNAHKKIVLKLREMMPDSQIIILPVGDIYQKNDLVDFEHRFQMLKLLFNDLENIYISRFEQTHLFNGTISSLDYLSKSFSDLCFVMGSDQLSHLKTWIQVDRLLKNYPIMILQRDKNLNVEQIEQAFQMYDHEFIWIPFDEDISSTQARNNRLIRSSILSQEVIDYINHNHLYEES